MTNNNNIRRLLVTGTILTSSLLGGNSAAFGQQTETEADSGELLFEEVIVTARRRESSVQDTPLSISAVGQQSIERQGIGDIADLFRTVPSVAVIDQGPSRKNIIIRGVQTSLSPEDSVTTVYVDEQQVSLGIGTMNPRTFDLDRVEVLRGPQGTLYGGGSIAGTFRYITNKPNTNEFETNFAGDLSTTKHGGTNYNLDGMVNIPLVEDKLAVRVVGYYGEDSGLLTNNTLGTTNQGASDLWGGRVAVRWDATEDFSLTAKVMHQSIKQNGFPEVDGTDLNSFVQNRFLQERLTEKVTVYDLTMEWDIGWATATSATGYLKFDNLRLSDSTGRFQSNPDGPFATNDVRVYVEDDNKNSAFTEEIRLVSNPDNFGNFQWIIGGYYENQNLLTNVGDFLGVGASLAPGGGALVDTGTVAGSQVDFLFKEVFTGDNRQIGLFGELTYNVTETLQGTFGVRQSNVKTSSVFDDIIGEEQEDDGTAILDVLTVPEFTEKHTNFKFNVAWTASDDLLLFAQAAQGFRTGSGGVAPQLSPSCVDIAQAALGGAPQALKSDSLWTYELGVKSTLADGKVTFNGTVFHNVWTDIQVEVDLGTATCAGITQNAAKGGSTGLEIETSARVTDNFRITASGSYVNATLKSDAPAIQATSGDKLPGSPNYQLALSGDYVYPISEDLNGYVRADYQYVGKILGGFAIGRPRTVSGEYGTMNLRFGVESEQWDVTAYASNLFDTRGKVFSSGTLANNNLRTVVLRPRTIGINFRTKF